MESDIYFVIEARQRFLCPHGNRTTSDGQSMQTTHIDASSSCMSTVLDAGTGLKDIGIGGAVRCDSLIGGGG